VRQPHPFCTAVTFGGGRLLHVLEEDDMLTPAWYLTDGDYFGELPTAPQLDTAESALSSISQLFNDEVSSARPKPSPRPTRPCSPPSTSTM
jgi:hypothetical protein